MPTDTGIGREERHALLTNSKPGSNARETVTHGLPCTTDRLARSVHWQVVRVITSIQAGQRSSAAFFATVAA